MAFTKLNDVDVRRDQYIHALDFYLKNTDFRIVFCENTLCDLSDQFREYIDAGRLDYLTFDGNNYDKTLGKGYGEALIILHAVENSKFITPDSYVVKITGRIIARNIAKVADSPYLLMNNVFRCNFQPNSMAETVVFIFQVRNFIPALKENVSKIDDYAVPTRYLENVVCDFILDGKFMVVPFFHSPEISGTRASDLVEYTYMGLRDNIRANLFYLREYYKQKGRSKSWFYLRLCGIFLRYIPLSVAYWVKRCFR